MVQELSRPSRGIAGGPEMASTPMSQDQRRSGEQSPNEQRKKEHESDQRYDSLFSTQARPLVGRSSGSDVSHSDDNGAERSQRRCAHKQRAEGSGCELWNESKPDGLIKQQRLSWISAA